MATQGSSHSSRHAHVSGKYRHIMGWQPDRPDHRDRMFLVSGAAVGSSCDNSDQVSRIEDQGELGSCTANASTSAMEALAKKNGIALPELSRLFVYYYTRKVDGTPVTEDAGATIRNTMKSLVVFGACAEKLWPYNIEAFSKAPTFRAVRDGQDHRIVRYYRCPTLVTVRAAIASGGTVVGGFSVPEGMLSESCARTGIVPAPGEGQGFVGGHAVHFVGYNDADRLVKFQNSWGEGWGKGGFGFLPYDFFEQKIAGDCWTIRSETTD